MGLSLSTTVRRLLVASVPTVLAATLLAAAPSYAAGPVNTVPPTISGTAKVGELLRSDKGTWTGTGIGYRYQWFRDGRWIRDADTRNHRLTAADLGHRMTVRVFATDGSGATSKADSAPTGAVARGTMTSRKRPGVSGARRFGATVRAATGTWSTTPTRRRYQWYSAGDPVRGATGVRFRLRPQDVGRRIQVQVRASAPGYTWASKRSRSVPIQHRVDVRRTVTYSVTTRGRISASVADFKRLAAQTYADPRGWRGGGVRFRQVASGGGFTLVLANANAMTSFSSACSSMWSCRVGRFVVINQERWKHASPAWNRAGRSLRDYRHMVVNHETGHWLGFGHARCPGAGKPAPVMMQQSKGRAGCRFNPWPTLGELRRAR